MKCPSCGKEVYFAEKVSCDGSDYHRPCHRCERCKKTIPPGAASVREGKLYCKTPCYATLFGPGGFRSGTSTPGSAIYKK